MRILVFLLIELLSPATVILMNATVVERTTGTCKSRETHLGGHHYHLLQTLSVKIKLQQRQSIYSRLEVLAGGSGRPITSLGYAFQRLSTSVGSEQRRAPRASRGYLNFVMLFGHMFSLAKEAAIAQPVLELGVCVAFLCCWIQDCSSGGGGVGWRNAGTRRPPTESSLCLADEWPNAGEQSETKRSCHKAD